MGRSQTLPVSAATTLALVACSSPPDERDDADRGPRFTEVTESAGIVFEPADPGCFVDCVDWIGGGVAVGDYDGDRLLDVYITRRDTADMLLRNRGDGTFENTTANAGLDVDLPSSGPAWLDIDDDGDLDLYVTVLGGGRHYLFVNEGGVFTEEAVLRGASIDNPINHAGFSAAFGDYDRDGYLDLHVTEWTQMVPTGERSNARLLRNLGEQSPGFFEDVTDAAGVSLDELSPGRATSFASALTDLDDDGWPDLPVVADFGTSRLFWNDQGRGFVDGTDAAGVGTDENGMGNALGDYDGDGDLDWFVTSIFDPDYDCRPPCDWGASGNRLYRNDGGRRFTDVTDEAGVRHGFWGWGASFFDYDNDGDLDLVMTNGTVFPEHQVEDEFNVDPMRLWRNDGGTFTEVADEAGLTDTGPGKGLAVFDYDDDGDLDVIVVNDPGGPKLFRNDGGNEKSFLRVRLVPRSASARGIGARVSVRVTPDGPLAVREIRGGNQFLGQNETIAHFGLGSGIDEVAEIRVRWPTTGLETVVENTPANTTVEVME